MNLLQCAASSKQPARVASPCHVIHKRISVPNFIPCIRETTTCATHTSSTEKARVGKVRDKNDDAATFWSAVHVRHWNHEAALAWTQAVVSSRTEPREGVCLIAGKQRRRRHSGTRRCLCKWASYLVRTMRQPQLHFVRTHSAWIRRERLIQLVGRRRIEDVRKAPKEGG